MPRVRTLSAVVLLLLCGIILPTAAGQTPKPSLPDPVKFVNKFETVWNVTRAVLDELDYSTELEDKAGGRITTKPSEFISGSLSASEIEKVAVKADTFTGSWMKARYSVEALLEIVTSTETLVTIRTKVEGLNRDFNGKETWVPLDSLGVFEKRILGKISLKLLGNEPQFNEKKGFWDKSPQPVTPRRPGAAPTRPPL